MYGLLAVDGVNIDVLQLQYATLSTGNVSHIKCF